MSVRVIGVLVTVGAGIGAFFSVGSVLWQQHAIHDFVATPATISNVHITVHHGKSTSYSPEADYTYVYQGKMHQSKQLLPFSESSSRSWATHVIDEIQIVGGVVEDNPKGPLDGTAYVNPADPDEAILVREYSFVPYVFSLLALMGVVLGAGLAGGVVTGGRSKMAAIALDESGWKLLLPAKNLKRGARDAALWTIGSMIALLPVVAHWIFVAGQWDLMAGLFGGLTGLFILALAVIAARRWSVSRHMSDVRLRVKPAPMQRGQPFELEAEADAYSPLRVREVTAKLRCIEHYKEKRGNKTNYGTRTYKEERMHLGGAAEVAPGQVVEGKTETKPDESLPPTTDISVLKSYPYYTWEVRVAVKLEKMVDYEGVFPLEVN